MRKLTTLAIASALLFGAAACGDLAVDNENAPDARRALANPGDVEALISGAWINWWYPTYHYDGGGPWMSTSAFQHSAYPANFAMVHYSQIPRVSTTNSTAFNFYPQISLAYTYWYRAIAGVNDGLRAILVDNTVDLGANETRAVAWGRFVQGLSYGYLALMYAEGPLIDENTDLAAPQEFVGYNQLMAASMAYLEEAATLAGSNTFTIPNSWMYMETDQMSSAQLAQMANSYKARIRANVARTPGERQNDVNWNAVLTDIQNGITSDLNFLMTRSGFSYNYSLYYMLLTGWGQLNYFVAGMADQSGKYQEWMGLPIGSRHPNLPSGAFIIQTPDLRFPQGATRDEQLANPGTRFRQQATPGDFWGRPDRGEWRWSYYHERTPHLQSIEGILPEMKVVEMDLLAAEAHYYAGNRAQAAELINKYRVPAGLNATDADGTNTSCVPKLPNGSCGGLFEILKWEKRMNSGMDHGLLSAAWFFDSRGWGDLMQGTIMQIPVPDLVAQLAGQPTVDFGGTLEWGAPVGTYGY
jgi:hypothetical protein